MKPNKSRWSSLRIFAWKSLACNTGGHAPTSYTETSQARPVIGWRVCKLVRTRCDWPINIGDTLIFGNYSETSEKEQDNKQTIFPRHTYHEGHNLKHMDNTYFPLTTKPDS